MADTDQISNMILRKEPTPKPGLAATAALWWGRLATLGRTARMFWKFTHDKPASTRPSGPLPVDRISPASLAAAPDRTLWRLGHSSVLLKLRGGFWLTDPVFAKRASPVWFAGPRRFHQPPLRIQDLPQIEAVILSHDHYDHLDKRAIRKLAKKTGVFLVPPGLRAILTRWGVKPSQVRELSWWQETEVAGLHIAATPTQHFSGRSLWNRNETGWTSWALIDDNFRLFYGADSGYFPGFKQIGDKYGPFDVTLMENGAYNVRWPQVHMQPEETVQAHRDLRGRWMIPVHNSTFDLAFHPWTEPMERIQALATTHHIPVCTPRFGEPVDLTAMHPATPWWRQVETAAVHASGSSTDPSPATHPAAG